MIRINLVRGKRKKRRELNIGSAWLALPLVVLAGTIYFHTTVSGKDLEARRGYREGQRRHRAPEK